MPMARGARCRGPPAAPPRVGKANAARVSRGSMVDKLDKTVKVSKPVRDPQQHVTVTVVIYNTVAGGVPSVEDVRAADGKQRRVVVAEEPSEDVDEPLPKKRRPPPKRGDKWEALFAV